MRSPHDAEARSRPERAEVSALLGDVDAAAVVHAQEVRDDVAGNLAEARAVVGAEGRFAFGESRGTFSSAPMRQTPSKRVSCMIR